MTTFKLQRPYIHGQYVDATSNSTFQTINPATGEVLAEVQVCSKMISIVRLNLHNKGKSLGRNDRDSTFAHLKQGSRHFKRT